MSFWRRALSSAFENPQCRDSVIENCSHLSTSDEIRAELTAVCNEMQRKPIVAERALLSDILNGGLVTSLA